MVTLQHTATHCNTLQHNAHIATHQERNNLAKVVIRRNCRTKDISARKPNIWHIKCMCMTVCAPACVCICVCSYVCVCACVWVCMCVRVCLCVCTYIHTYIRANIQSFSFFLSCMANTQFNNWTKRAVNIHTYKQTFVHTYIHTYIHTYTHTWIHTCTHTYIHARIHAYIHTCIHTHKYRQTDIV